MTSPPSAPAPVVRPALGSRLDALAAEYAQLQPQVEALNERLKAVSDGIKTELAGTGAEATLLSSPHLPFLLKVALTERWVMDSKRLKAEHPALWVTYAKKSHSWRLDRVQG